MTIPHDLLMLLGKLDGKLDAVQTSLAAITAKIDAQDSRLTHVEAEIASIKADRSAIMPDWIAVKGEVAHLKQALSNAKFLWSALIVAGGAIAWSIEHFRLLG